MSARLLIVKAGTTLPEILPRRGDFEVWIIRAMGLAETDVDVVAPFRGEPLPDPGAHEGVVVTGSAAFVSECEPWSEQTAAWLPAVVDAGTALLGICYGHQLLAHAYGGQVGRNPRGRGIGTVEVDLTPARERRDALLGGLPVPTRVHTTHLESVLELPPEAVGLGASPVDPHHAFAIGPRAWGVQFHPEFDADIVRGYIEAREAALRDEGLDPTALAAGARDTPVGDQLLRRFGEIASGALPVAPGAW